MKKGIALIAMLALAVLMLSGCNLIGYDEELDGAQPVAKVNDTEITKAEWLAYRDYLASYYQQYMQQYFGYSMDITEDDLKVYGETALENMIKSQVLADKMAELGFDPLGEEDAASVEAYADSMWSFYKQLVRYQNYPDVETVEEEAERLAQEAAAAAEATPDEAAAEAMDYFYELYEGIDETAINAMTDAGVTFVEIDKAPLMEACAPALEKFVADNGLEDMYAAIQALA